MRKLLKITFTFAVALVFMAGTALAQDDNEAVIDQTGDDHVATIDQVGSLNEGEVVQSGGVNFPFEGTIDQTGDENSATVTQNGNHDIRGSVEQIGDNNSGHVSQGLYGSDLGIGRIYQEGDNNVASQDQSAAGGGVANRIARTDQIGDSNLARTTQTHFYPNAELEGFILQDGNNNEARITQGGDGSGAIGAMADITQNGNGLFAEVTQSGSVTQP